MPTRPLRVLHVIDTLGFGGAEMNLATLVAHLPPDAFEQHIAFLGGPQSLRDKLVPHVKSIVSLETGLKTHTLPVAVARLHRWMTAHKPDVVHAQLILAQLVTRAAAKLARVPVVTTWQNAFYDAVAISEFGGSPLRREVVRRADRMSSKRDARFVAVSQYVADDLCRALAVPQERVSVIYNAVEQHRYATVAPERLAALRAELKLAPNAHVILTVGRLVPQKAQVDLVEAMGTVAQSDAHAVLLVAGAGALLGPLKTRAAALGLADRVVFLGSRPDVPALFQLADVFAFSSIYEGLSVALVEAIANGLPCVVTDIRPNLEVAQGLSSVHFVPPHAPRAMADGILRVLADLQDQRQAARGSQEAVRQRFSAAVLARSLGHVLNLAASDGRGL